MSEETDFDRIISGLEDDKDYTDAYLRIKKAKALSVLTGLVLLLSIPVNIAAWVAVFRYAF